MTYLSRINGMVLAVGLVLGGCTCWNDEGCADGAVIRYRTDAPGPYEVQLCIDGDCTGVQSFDAGAPANGLGGLPADRDVSVWASRQADDTTEIVVWALFTSLSKDPPPPSEYRLVLTAADGRGIDETFPVEYPGYHPGGEFCTGKVCWRAELEGEF